MTDNSLVKIGSLARRDLLDERGLNLTDPNLPIGDWLDLMRALAAVRDVSAFAIGDGLLYGEAIYGEEFAQVEAVLGRSPETLRDFLRVSRDVPRSIRRLPELSWRHHRLVAPLPRVEQKKLLAAAVKNEMSTRELADVIHEAARLEAGARPPESSDSAHEGRQIVVEALEKAARDVYRQARANGDGTHHVETGLIVRLGAALGEGT